MRLFVFVAAVAAAVLGGSDAMSRDAQRMMSPCVWSPFEICGVTAS